MTISLRIAPGFWFLMGLMAFQMGCAPKSDEVPLQPEKVHPVRAMVLKPGHKLQEVLEISGPVDPVRGVDLAAETAGTVVDLVNDKGATLNKGEIILTQDRTILAAELAAAQADLVPLEFNKEKMRALYTAQKISEFEMLQAENACAQGQARVKTNRRRFEQAAISAPFAGVVVDRFVELGQYLLPAQKAVRFIDPFTLKLVGYVSDKDVGRVQVGRSCPVWLGTGNESATGTVSYVSCEADLQNGKFKVEIEIPNPELKLNSGVIGRTRLPLTSTAKVVIPRDAVLHDLSGSVVFLAHGSRAQRQAVTLGSDQGAIVSVLKGLDLGDTLIIRGQRDLREGNQIGISEWSVSPDGTMPGDPDALRGNQGNSDLERP